MAQDHRWDPEAYAELVRLEVPAYERLQDELVDATRDLTPTTILELGCGTGETTRRVLAVHPDASLVAVDESPDMLGAAARALPPTRVELRRARLEDPLSEGPFDLVVSALAVHHLDAPGKADLFGRIAAVLAPGGRFVLADLVVPEDPADVVTAIDGDYDRPDTVAAQLGWLRDAGLRLAAQPELQPGVAWAEGDLAVMRGAQPDR